MQQNIGAAPTLENNTTMNKVCCYAIILALIGFGFGTADAQQNIAQQTYAIFQQNCLNCHGPHGAFTEQIVIDSASGLVNSGAVVPGNPVGSELYTRLLETDPAKRMPLGGQLSADAIVTIGNWIQAGAPTWEIQHDVNFISTDTMLTVIQNHLGGLDAFDRPFTRYFTMTHLYNAGEGPEALRAYQVALSKLVNSLSWGFQIINPEPIDAAETIFYIDLRNYEWDTREAWPQMEAVYPYLIDFDETTQATLYSKLTHLRQEMNCEVPFVYADWFLATASLPPLYHDILALPETEQELERELRIDVDRNLQSAPGVRVWRAGTNDSGVSNHNRVVERHTSPYGAYWKSHDFAGSAGAQNIFTHPLSFQRDGGEVIFNLPNGLQAYYIADGFGNRIDVAPTEIVSNPAASDPAVRNGLSCIGCHTEGMKDFADGVRSVIEQTVSPVYDKDHALRLYVENEVMGVLVAQDTLRYKAALEATGGVFGGIEPVHRFYEEFHGPIEAAYAAAAVGLETEIFLSEIAEKSSLQRLGLTGLLSGGNVKRDAWTAQFPGIISALNSPDMTDTPNPDNDVGPGPIFSGLIPDPNLRAAIAERLGKAPAALTETDLTRLTEIVADEKGIRDLTGLEHAIRLERIEFRHNAISDLSPLAGLVRLDNIKLRGNKITDVSPLAGLINVDWLGLEENAITDLSPLKGLVKLNGIGIEGNPVTDVSALAGMISLEGIVAWNTAITDFSALAKLPRFQWIELSGSSISELPSLTGLKRLRRLEINHTYISDISGLAEVPQLTSLTLHDNQITDVSPLANLKNLTNLNLSHNIISDVSPLAGLTKLERIDLRNNAISDFSPLEGLPIIISMRTSGNPGTALRGGPKITGPWLWIFIPDIQHENFRNADLLARVSGGDVTELKIASDGATEGKSVGEHVWTPHKLSPSVGTENINSMLKALGISKGDGGNLTYGSLTLNSPREQQTKMFAGSDDSHKIWLNGELVSEKYNAWTGDYQQSFPVTLKEGKNVLLVAVYDYGGGWSGHFGFAPDAEYTVIPPGSRFTLSTALTQLKKSDTFIVRLNAANITDLAGWQTDIAFDPALLKANNVSEGNFLKQGNGRTFFRKGTIKNRQGRITGIQAARISKGGVAGEGNLLSVSFTALANGQGRVVLRNFRAGNSAGETISATAPDVMVTVGNTPAAPVLLPDETALLANYPNPFNPETWIPYQLAEPAKVTLYIYATNGALVRRLDLGHQAAGLYQYRSRAAYWDGRNEVGEPVASGIYFYTLSTESTRDSVTAGDFTATRKMLIRK
ncbi:MAG: leucine-rich repeat protein [Candidatus Poribacteria bacterium]|nr:leucine-rich repeat protein [Candidatus Poribacteria bacterium]